MGNYQVTTDILVVGAGMAGLTAASELRRKGYRVLVVDKGRGLGGRLATRRIGQAVFDHGAQFFTTRDPRFTAAVEEWRVNGVVEEWFRSASPGAAGHPRWRGSPSMTAVAKFLARGLDVRLGKQLAALRRLTDGWAAVADDGETVTARAVILTPPAPQSLALLEAGQVELPPPARERLDAITYERCLAVMALLDGLPRIPPPGGLAPGEGPIAWIADNQAKGISPVPAVTIHAGPAFSQEWWERDRQESGQEMLQAAQPWLGAAVIEFQVHGWRYSKPLRIGESPDLVLRQDPPLVTAGDAFAAPRVEGAFLSGLEAVGAIRHLLPAD